MQGLDGNWVTVDAAANTLGVAAETLRGWCRLGAIESFREGPHARYVRLDQVQAHVYSIRGRPQTSLATLIASSEVPAGPKGARISELQGLIRERLHA